MSTVTDPWAVIDEQGGSIDVKDPVLPVGNYKLKIRDFYRSMSKAGNAMLVLKSNHPSGAQIKDEYLVMSFKSKLRKFMDAMGVPSDEPFNPGELDTDTYDEEKKNFGTYPEMRGVEFGASIVIDEYTNPETGKTTVKNMIAEFVPLSDVE